MSALETYLGADTDANNVALETFDSSVLYNMSLLSVNDEVGDYYVGPNQSGGEEYGFYCRNFEGNISYLNVSCETNLKFSVPLYGWVEFEN